MLPYPDYKGTHVKILVYDDNPGFGGHQVMAAHGVAALAEDPSNEIICMVHPENRPLKKLLAGFQTLEPANNFQPLELDRVLCIQGDIAQSSKGVRAARRAGIECISYIAIPHRMAAMGAKLGALRDRLNQPLLNLPDRYIAISESMKRILVERGVTKPITIVKNGIPAPSPLPAKPADSRPSIGLLGRIEFNQKQQDFMVQAFLEQTEAFDGYRLLIAGNGPDEKHLQALINGQDAIDLLPWQENTQAFYEQIDFLVIPSRYEGFPLVMLEALARGIPTLGSACDGMLDVLPRAWTFEPGNARALAAAFSDVRNQWKELMPALREKIMADYSLETFKTNFRHAVMQESAAR